MGELHLGITFDRILREYGISASLGELHVAYRETPSISVRQSGIYFNYSGKLCTNYIGIT